MLWPKRRRRMSVSMRGRQSPDGAETKNPNWAGDGLLAKEEQRILRDRGLGFATFAGQRQRREPGWSA